jgi:hypothetical protein
VKGKTLEKFLATFSERDLHRTVKNRDRELDKRTDFLRAKFAHLLKSPQSKKGE